MKKNFMNSLYLFLFSHIAIIILSLIFYQRISLLHYINISFFLSLLFILFSLTVYIIKAGFFDITHRAFRRLFVKKEISEEQSPWQPLSEMMTMNYFPVLCCGVFLFLCMIAALFGYYFI